MPWWNKKDYPIDQIRGWVQQGKTQTWIGGQLGVDSRQIYKVCKIHGIKCLRRGPRSGSDHKGWKGGRRIDKSGYVLIYFPGHPFAGRPSKKYVREHRLVMEKHLGRFLDRKEVVHHRDGDKQNNSIENLELFLSNSAHLKHELKGRVPNWTEAGRARSLAGVQKWRDSRRALKLGGPSKQQTIDHPTVLPGTADLTLSEMASQPQPQQVQNH